MAFRRPCPLSHDVGKRSPGSIRSELSKYCYCGGDVLPIEVFKRWKDLLGLNIYQVYGSTEAGHVTYSRLNKDPELMSIGYPLKSRRCNVVDPESLVPVPLEKLENSWSLPTIRLRTIGIILNETRHSYVEIEGKIYYLSQTTNQHTLRQ